MRLLAATTVGIALVLLTVLPAGSRNLESFEFSVSRPVNRQVKWPGRKISVALSTSLATPGQNFKLGTDVVGAAHRAVSRWARVANINFVESSSTLQSISSGSGDGVSLITIADTRENNAIFSNAEMTGRTRVFFDPESGSISEADICINPHPALSDGTPVQFSTDGTPGTYDLESTFTHEIGHLLGLDHSVIWASTMQARQGLNGVYGLPGFSGRTISEEDLECVRRLYSGSNGSGIGGKLNDTFSGGQVWIENVATGRVAASGLVASDGTYLLDGITAGQYRLFAEQPNRAFAEFADMASPAFDDLGSRTAEISDSVPVAAKSSSPVTVNALTPRVAQFLNPRVVGMNSELSTVPLPLEAGKSFKLYVGGEGIDELVDNGITVTSPFFHVEPKTLTREAFKTSFPVVSFQVSVAPNTPFGDYTIRVQSLSGEVALLPGSITIDPGVQSTAANPLDDPQFFVSQHYRDFLGRDPEPEGLSYWVNQLRQCGQDANCMRARKLGISNAFFAEGEFQDTGSFVYGLFKTLGRLPTFAEFFDERKTLTEASGDVDNQKKLLASQFVNRQEFLNKYPAKMNGEQFVSAVLAETQQTTNTSLDRARLVSSYDGSDAARATIVQTIISNAGFLRAEYSRAYVLMQYFAYFRRDPDESGYNSWLNILQNKNSRDSDVFRSVSCAFLSSPEYQSRFGMVITHNISECR